MKKLILLITLFSTTAWAKISYVSGKPNDRIESKWYGLGYEAVGYPCNASFNEKTKMAVMVLHKKNFTATYLRAMKEHTNIRIEEVGEFYRLSFNNMKRTYSPYVSPSIRGYQGFWTDHSDFKFTDDRGNHYIGSFNTYVNLDADSGSIYAIHLQQDFKCHARTVKGELYRECSKPELEKTPRLSCYMNYKVD